MAEKEKGEQEEKLEKENSFEISELERWMTEGTDPRLIPRSDCG